MNHILINVASFRTCVGVRARALFASHSRESDDDLNNQRQKNKSPGILRTRGLIN